MVKKGHEVSDVVGYTLGIISIVLAFFTPIAGLVFGIIGHGQVRKQNTELSKKARKLNLIGIVISVIILILTVVVLFYSVDSNLNSIANFPVG